MNRRNFFKATGGIALATSALAAGCVGDARNDIGSGSDGDGGGAADISVNITTSDEFDELATHDEPTVTIETRDVDDGETREIAVAEYILEPTNDECADVTAHVKAYDIDGVVVHEFDARDQFDPGEKYRITHTVPKPPEEVSEIAVELTVNSMSAMCYM